MIKKSDSSWFQFDSNVVLILGKYFFSKLACFVTFLDHFVLHMRTGNLISIIKKSYDILEDLLHKVMSKC